MKKNLLITLTAVALIFASCGETKTEAPAAPATPLTGDAKLTVDAAGSKVTWEGNMTGLKIYSHEGNINIKDGNVTLKDGKLTGGAFTIDMTSIKPTDANYSAEDNHTVENLVGHLSSPDFFDIANNPTATFAITSVEGSKVNGNLTIRGKTNPETLELGTIALDGMNVKLTGSLTFDRQKYGVAFAMPTKDMLLADNITIGVDLLAKK